MKLAFKFTWDSELAKQRIKCFFHHDWERYQYLVQGHQGDLLNEQSICVAFKVCRRCAKSKLIHIFT